MNRHDLSDGGARGELAVANGPESMRGALPGGNRMAADHPPGTVLDVRKIGGSSDPEVDGRGRQEGLTGERIRGKAVVVGDP
jgi:hypothetical protein